MSCLENVLKKEAERGSDTWFLSAVTPPTTGPPPVWTVFPNTSLSLSLSPPVHCHKVGSRCVQLLGMCYMSDRLRGLSNRLFPGGSNIFTLTPASSIPVTLHAMPLYSACFFSPHMTTSSPACVFVCVCVCVYIHTHTCRERERKRKRERERERERARERDRLHLSPPRRQRTHGPDVHWTKDFCRQKIFVDKRFLWTKDFSPISPEATADSWAR